VKIDPANLPSQNQRISDLSTFVIAKNALFNILAFLVNLAMTIVLVPVMLQYLGNTGFGVWALVRVFVSYASLGDLGLTSTVTKFVAEYSATNRTEEIARVLKSAFVLYVWIILTILAVAFLFRGVIIDTFFATDGDAPEEAVFVLYASLVIFGTNTVFSILPNALNGIQRMDLTNSVTALYSVLNGVGMYGALVAGWGLQGLVWANAFASIAGIIMNWILFSRHFGHLGFLSVPMTLNDIRHLFGLSKHIFVVSLASNIHQHFDKLLLGSFMNLTTVASYEVGSRMVQQARLIPILMLNPLLPASSEFHAHDSTDRIRELYYRSLKYLVVLSVPMLGCLGLYAPEIIKVWIGDADELIAPTLRILLLSNFVNLLTGPGFFISIGVGSARLPMYSSLLGLSLNVVLSVLLLQWFGYFGAVFGSFIALIIASVFFLFIVHRRLGISWSPVFKIAYPPLLAMLPGFGVALLAASFVDQAFLQLVLMVGCTVVLFGISLWAFRYFDEFDKRSIAGIWKRLNEFMLLPPEGI